MSETGTDAKLVRMANQIATFFLSQPEEVRVEGVATHINKFWETRMRRRFFELMAIPDAGFLPLVVEAASQVKRPGEPMPPRSALATPPPMVRLAASVWPQANLYLSRAFPRRRPERSTACRTSFLGHTRRPARFS